MAGRPSAAAEKAAKWLAAGKGTPAEAARKFGLSPRQAQRIAAAQGLAPQPVGRPPAPPEPEQEPKSLRHLRYYPADPGF